MIPRLPSPRYLETRDVCRPDYWERLRKDCGLNFAEMAQQQGVTLREYAMLECGVTPEELADGYYPRTGGRPKIPTPRS